MLCAQVIVQRIYVIIQSKNRNNTWVYYWKRTLGINNVQVVAYAVPICGVQFSKHKDKPHSELT